MKKNRVEIIILIIALVFIFFTREKNEDCKYLETNHVKIDRISKLKGSDSLNIFYYVDPNVTRQDIDHHVRCQISRNKSSILVLNYFDSKEMTPKVKELRDLTRGEINSQIMTYRVDSQHNRGVWIQPKYMTNDEKNFTEDASH